MDKKMFDLKPCPFCGGKSITRFVVTKIEGFAAANTSALCTVECGECGVKKGTELELCETNFDEIADAMLETVEEWNRRAT